MRVNPATAEPLTAADFARLVAPFEPFEKRPEIAVAVSGGRDSLCLALLAHDWVKARGGKVRALIVDHGLREGSAAEAAVTRDRLRECTIDADILQWQGDKPEHGLQAAARGARYRLLFDACRRHGLLHLLVGHHADDQSETVAMRAARGSGPAGLAGMPALAEHRNVRVLRPLLEIARARLTATLVIRGVSWVEDPSNLDLRFERGRLRRGCVPLATAATDGGAARAVGEAGLAEVAVRLLEVDERGQVGLDHQCLAQLEEEMAQRLVSRIVQAVGARQHPPRQVRLMRAVARLRAPARPGKSGKGQDFTLSECRWMLRRAPGEPRSRWIVRAENGKKSGNNPGQPLVPARFFACGATAAHHVD